MKFLILGVFFFTLNSVYASWFIKDKNRKCISAGDISPDELLNSSIATCQKKHESDLKTILKCKSEFAAFNGENIFYPSKEGCTSDGGTFNTKKYKDIKGKWRKNYNSKMWMLMASGCKNKILPCFKGKVTAKQSIATIVPSLVKQGYNCSNNFDIVLSSNTPPETMAMALICLNTKTMCSDSVFFFNSKNECEKEYNEKVKK